LLQLPQLTELEIFHRLEPKQLLVVKRLRALRGLDVNSGE
jgi:hypothetical protein